MGLEFESGGRVRGGGAGNGGADVGEEARGEARPDLEMEQMVADTICVWRGPDLAPLRPLDDETGRAAGLVGARGEGLVQRPQVVGEMGLEFQAGRAVALVLPAIEMR